MRWILISFLLFNMLSCSEKKETISGIENELHEVYQKIQSDRSSEETSALDSLEIDSKIFKEKMTKYLATYPETLTHNFDSLKKENIHIVTSEDKLFRIYSWNTFLGGTMQDFENIFQYKSNDKVYCKNSLDKATHEGVYIPFFSQIFTLKTSQKTYYLAVKNGIYSTHDISQSIQIYTIEDNQLIDSVKLIKTKSGLTNTIDVHFNYFSVADRPERPLELIRFDKEKKILFIPLVYEDGTVTDKFILYKFNGDFFENIQS